MNREKDRLNKKLSEKEILNNMFKYCSYQERCIHDVEKQLEKYQVSDLSRKQIIEKLNNEGFLNEERYAETYTISKLRSNNWGKIKIVQGLKEKSIDGQIINAAVESIDSLEYQQVIKKLIRKKLKFIRDTELFIIKNKIARYIIGKGFESYLVWDEINDHINEQNSD